MSDWKKWNPKTVPLNQRIEIVGVNRSTEVVGDLKGTHRFEARDDAMRFADMFLAFVPVMYRVACLPTDERVLKLYRKMQQEKESK